jgi:hypothetical protein
MPRPHLHPTDEQRQLVKFLAAAGIRQTDIARIIGIRSPKTVRKYFRRELDLGSPEANTMVAKTLYKKAVAGDTTAAIFWLKCRAGWREHGNSESAAAPAPPFLVSIDRGQS